MLKRAALLFCLCLPIGALAATPAAVVESFDAALLDAMKNAQALGPKGRFDRLVPVMAENFDLAAMTRDITGAQWGHLSPGQRERLISDFSRFQAAIFADWFDSAAGQTFQVRDIVTRNDDVAVVGVVLSGPKSPLRFEYVLRTDASGAWRIVDVRYEGWMSTVERRRSEFADILGRYGFDELAVRLEKKSGELLEHPDDAESSHLQKPLRELWTVPIAPIW